ncbi:hypothetical protein Poly24_43630 [Rosistilla carotiformis]|uniref:Uncharacterized protein n=1 Tax=Rosistilla carotiformis TaxID=2528017 RepID=A0A518JYL0_9BACT|nr:hypothetical protein Poly24_43630 [Rosistilla carotiformis]
MRGTNSILRWSPDTATAAPISLKPRLQPQSKNLLASQGPVLWTMSAIENAEAAEASLTERRIVGCGLFGRIMWADDKMKSRPTNDISRPQTTTQNYSAVIILPLPMSGEAAVSMQLRLAHVCHGMLRLPRSFLWCSWRYESIVEDAGG